MSQKIMFLAIGLLGLAACADPYTPTPKPGYTIRVVPSANGMVAVPPTCPSYATATTDPYDNQPMPQFGCANARNLAMMVERPEDLIKGRDLGPASGVTAVGTMVRYNNNQTRGLLWTGVDPNTVATTSASTSASSLTGEVAASASSSSSSSTASSTSSSSSAPATAP